MHCMFKYFQVDAEFKSQRHATSFRAGAEQCFRLAASMTQLADGDRLRTFGKELEAQARFAEGVQPASELPALL